MKIFSRFTWLVASVLIAGSTELAFSQANTTLSNLVSPTAVNQSIIPSSTNSKDLGTSTLMWRTGYFAGKGYFTGGIAIGSTVLPSTMLDITPPSTSAGAVNLKPNTGLIPSTGELRFSEVGSNGTNYVGFKAPSSILANKIWILPSADGTSGQVLSTNGSGALSWVSAPSGGTSVAAGFIPRSDGSTLVAGTLTDNGSKIGLGTASPGAYLHISADGNADLPHLLIKDLDADGYARIYMNTFTGELGDERKWKILARTSLDPVNNDFLIQQVSSTNGTNFTHTRLSIDHDGNVGIGTGVPTGTLHVNSSFVGNAFIVGPEVGTPDFVVDGIGQTGVNVADPNARFHVNGTSSEDALRVDVNGSTKVMVNGSGNLGVGTTTPAAKLHINGSAEVLRIDGTDPYAQFYNAAVAKGYVQVTGSDFKLGTVGTNTGGKVQITAGSSTALTIASSGNVGIGTTTPSIKLHLKGSNELLRLDGTSAQLQFYNGGFKGFMKIEGNDVKLGTNGGNTTGDLYFYTNNNAHMMIDESGNITMGTFDPGAGYKLSVGGKIICEELKVQLQPFPDYVFEEDYKLASLYEVEASIRANKHLPGFPAAKEVEESMGIGELQTKMMEKLEELTLYVIDLQKQNDALKQDLASLRAEQH
jgi:hypothetical protein